MGNSRRLSGGRAREKKSAMTSHIRDLEREALDHVAAIDKVPKAAASGLSIAGRGGALWIAVTAGLVARRGRMRRAGIAGAAAWLTADVAAHLLKRVVPRSRPTPRLSGSGPNPSTSSMPSSHAAASAGYAFAAGTVEPRLAAPVGALAAGVAWSRLARERHFPSDVAVGTLLGAAVGIACARAMRRLPGG